MKKNFLMFLFLLSVVFLSSCGEKNTSISMKKYENMVTVDEFNDALNINMEKSILNTYKGKDFYFQYIYDSTEKNESNSKIVYQNLEIKHDFDKKFINQKDVHKRDDDENVIEGLLYNENGKYYISRNIGGSSEMSEAEFNLYYNDGLNLVKSLISYVSNFNPSGYTYYIDDNIFTAVLLLENTMYGVKKSETIIQFVFNKKSFSVIETFNLENEDGSTKSHTKTYQLLIKKIDLNK